MISRPELWQQLLQHGNLIFVRIAHFLRARAGSWPGFIALALLVAGLTTGLFFWRASSQASAQAQSDAPAEVGTQPISGALAQIATRTPTRRASAVATATRTPTSTAQPTSRPPTPTWTPLPTRTPVAGSPLPMPVIMLTATPTHSVPLPAELTGPQMMPPVGIISGSVSAAQIAPSTEISTTASVSATTALPTPAGAGITQLLVPTPTPTLTIQEALEQPVATPEPDAAGGMAGIVATATAALPPEAEEETPAEAIAPPAPTAASQPTPDGSPRTARIPVLMYHYISEPPAGADIYRQDLSVAPDLFAAHLDAMQQAGYTPISLYAFLEHLTRGATLPEKPVVLTFDDGYRDQYSNAFPLLRERGMTATFFIVTDFIYDQRPEYLTWDMVREMYAAGMSIEGHGRNHVSLANKDRDYLIWQALGTYEAIEYEIGVRPRFISYPAGEYDERTIDIFRSANYWAGFTTKQGATHHSDDLFQLRRIRVRGSTSPDELLRLLALDW